MPRPGNECRLLSPRNHLHFRQLFEEFRAQIVKAIQNLPRIRLFNERQRSPVPNERATITHHQHRQGDGPGNRESAAGILSDHDAASRRVQRPRPTKAISVLARQKTSPAFRAPQCVGLQFRTQCKPDKLFLVSGRLGEALLAKYQGEVGVG